MATKSRVNEAGVYTKPTLRKQIFERIKAGGGKSGLHRAGCQVTPGRREPTTSATESKPPMARLRDQVRVKGCSRLGRYARAYVPTIFYESWLEL